MLNFSSKRESIQIYPNLFVKKDNENINHFLQYFNKPKLNSIFFEMSKNTKSIDFPKRFKSRINFHTKMKKQIVMVNLKMKKQFSFTKDNKNKNKQKIVMTENHFDNDLFEKEKNKIFLFSEETKNKDNNHHNYDDNNSNNNYYLLKKAIYLQNNNIKRTDDVKNALKLFLANTKLIKRIKNNLLLIESKNKGEEKKENKSLIELKVNNLVNRLISKLAEKIIIKIIPKNQFLCKMNDIGEDCYFLIRGKVSILKPIECKGIKMTYKDYLIYLKCLLNLDEIKLVMKVLSKNRNFLDIDSVEKINRLIRAYFVFSLKKELNKNIGGITMDKIEYIFNEFHFTFEDFQLNKKKIIDDINCMEFSNDNFNKFLLNYIFDHISVSTEDLSLLGIYKIFNGQDERNDSLVTLYKYDNFLFLYPGSFFEEHSLESTNQKSDVSIRTEEDCILCSLNSQYYYSILSEENKRLRFNDLNFLRNNFFFKKIPLNNFNKYYFRLFKVVEKNKGNIIYKQNEKIDSILFLKEGTVKCEFKASIIDLNNYINKIINEILSKINYFKISIEKIIELRKNYIIQNDIPDSQNEEMKKKINYELFSSNGYECLGIQEFCLDINSFTTCTIISSKAIFMEIKKDDLSKIINNEREIISSFYKFNLIKLISLIKRLFYLNNNALNNKKETKINQNVQTQIFFKTIKKDNFMKSKIKTSNDHKQKKEILNFEKIKNIFRQKLDTININNNAFTSTNKSLFLIKNNDNYSSNSLISFKNKSDKNTLKIKKNFFSNLSFNKNNNKSFSLKSNNFQCKKILKYNYKNSSDAINELNNESINIKKGNIIKQNNIKRKKEIYLKKLIILKKNNYNIDKENSFSRDASVNVGEQLVNNEYTIINEKNQDELQYKNNESKLLSINKDEISNYYNQSNSSKTLEQNIEFKNLNNFNKYNFSSLPSIKRSKIKIKNLIEEMKQKYAISLGQKKIIYYKNPKKNKSINLIEENKKSFTNRKQITKKIIKDYYLKKKLEGYSSIINPLHNTYINRQKTIQIKKGFY